MKILFCRSNPIAPDPRVEKEARALIHTGHVVTVLGWDRSGTLPCRETHHGINIFRLAIKSAYATGMANLPQLLKWEFGLSCWLISHRNEYDCVHACDFDTILPALLAKTLFGKLVVYDIFDFYADHLRKVPAWIKGLIRQADLWAIGKSNALILADDGRLKQIAGSKPRETVIIYNSPEDVGNIQAEENTFSPSAKLRIAYIGLLQIERGLLEMLHVLQAHPEWEMALAGFGGDEKKLLDAAGQMSNLRWYGRVPYDRALRVSAAADVLFATYDPAIPNHLYSSPNKVFESMMLGKPIIVAKGTNIDRIIENHHNGLAVAYGNTHELEGALLMLTTNLALRQEMGNYGRRAYDEAYSWAIMRNRLVTLYAGLKHS